jgi:hypothetical protein
MRESGGEQMLAAGDWLELFDAGQRFYAIIAPADGVDVAIGEKIGGEVYAEHDQRRSVGPDVGGQGTGGGKIGLPTWKGSNRTTF